MDLHCYTSSRWRLPTSPGADLAPKPIVRFVPGPPIPVRRVHRNRLCRALAPTYEVDGNTLGERGFVERHIFEFRPSRMDAVGDLRK